MSLRLRFFSFKLVDLDEEYCNVAVQNDGGGALRALPAEAVGSYWGNGKDIYGMGGGCGARDKEFDASGFLFPGFQFHSAFFFENHLQILKNAGIGQLKETNNQPKWHSCPHNEIVSCVQLTSDAMENSSSSDLQMMQSANSSENLGRNVYVESVLMPSSRALPEMPSKFVSPVPNISGFCMNFVKSEILNVMDKNKEEWIDNTGCRVFQSFESNKQGMLQMPNYLMFSEDLEFRCRDLQVILCKELTNSDVGNIGRIVLPKREAEIHLPPLSERDGMLLHMEDMTLPITWKFKYRFWPNNRSRMYILENTGDFVRAHCLQAGDSLIIYRKSASGNYIVRGKKGMPPKGECQLSINEDCGNSVLYIKRATSARRVPMKRSKNFVDGSSSVTITGTNSFRTDFERDNSGTSHYFA